MSERSVAEIIAAPPTWGPNALLCASCGRIWEWPVPKRSQCCGDCWYPPEDWVNYLTEPTVDDLLAWLREQVASEVEPGCGDAIEMYWDPEHPDMCSVCIGIGQWDAPTLLAALELTVRAMAGES